MKKTRHIIAAILAVTLFVMSTLYTFASEAVETESYMGQIAVEEDFYIGNISDMTVVDSEPVLTRISFGFKNLSTGEMEIYPEAIELIDYSDIAWSINYLQMGLFVEIVLIDENGDELIQKVEGGSADGSFKELSSGNYQLAVRCSEDNLKNKNQRSLSGTVSFSY